MTALVAVAAATAVIGLSALLINLGGRRRSAPTPLDTEAELRWMVAHAPRHARRVLSVAERRLYGGAGLALALAVVFATAFTLGSLLDMIDRNQGFARWDRAVAEWGRDHASDDGTAALRLVTQLGGTRWLLGLICVAGLVARRRHRSWNVPAYLLIVALGVVLLNNGLKLAVGRDRPDLGQLTGHAGSSFPSGHTAAAAACWAALALVWSRRRDNRAGRDRALAAAGAAAITAAVAASRVLLGVHWLTDVLAGALMGWGWFLFATIVFGGRLLRFGSAAERVAGDGDRARDPVAPGGRR